MTTMEKRADGVLIEPRGKITAINADDFRRELQERIDAGNLHLTVDLDGVDLIDSKGLAVFIVCHNALTAKGGSLTVVTDNPSLRGLFKAVRLDKHFTVRGSD